MNGVPILNEYKGQMLNLKQLAKACGVSFGVLRARYHKGERGDQLTRPADPRFSRRGR